MIFFRPKFSRMTVKTIVIGLILLNFLFACQQSEPLPTNTSLLWSDEFNGTSLDLNKWEIQSGDGSDYGLYRWGNNEEQYYTSDNITVSSGKLKIKSITENINGYNYTSGRIRSLNKGDFKYGRIEASIKMASTPGLWHAFWMLPSDMNKTWPIGGEIDIMEYVGNQSDKLFNTVHFADVNGNHQEIGFTFPFVNDNSFHIYAVEWDETGITWYKDSEETFTLARTNTRLAPTYPFDSEFHILLNTAIGGNLGGNVDPASLSTPQYMEVDYVRVYGN